MDSVASSKPSLARAVRGYWSRIAVHSGRLSATRSLLGALWDFARNSTPSRLRQRYGDADYDWHHRVNTTSAALGWRDRLLGALHSPYQPTDPVLFQEMMGTLEEIAHPNLPDFTFIDLGSGKGRTLLMASDYPFRRIIGVELLPSLDQIANENLRRYKNDSQQCFTLESVCADATQFPLPSEPLVGYLFNPFPEPGLRQVIGNLEQSLREHPRAVYVLYHNPLLEHVLAKSASLRKIGATHQFSIFSAR